MNNFPFQVIDLTQIITSQSPCWEGNCGFRHILINDYAKDISPSFRVGQFQLYAGIGTHLDAPAHCVPGGKTIDALKLTDLIAPCIVIDVSAGLEEKYVLSPDDILQFEKQYGQINNGSFVIIYTGWSRYWSVPANYRNELCFPSVSKEAALLLLQRNIVGLGIDTLSPDRPESGFPVHQSILGAGKYLVENIANANLLPAIGAYILALPIFIAGATEAPVRLIGLIGNK